MRHVDQGLQRQKLFILGTGSFAPEVADLADETDEYEIVAFVDDQVPMESGRTLAERPVVSLDEAARLSATHRAVCALGNPSRREFIEKAAALGFSFASIVHPSVRLSRKSAFGAGTILSTGVIVAAYTKIGRHVLINRGSLIGHHVTLGDYATVSPGANIAASVAIGEGTYIGMGAIVLDHRTIGAHAVVGAGAVVTHDVPDHAKVMGVPARIVNGTAERQGVQGE